MKNQVDEWKYTMDSLYSLIEKAFETRKISHSVADASFNPSAPM